MKQSAIKEQVIATASQLFYDQGYNLTGINQIIAESKVAKGSMYKYFKSKTSLLLAYLNNIDLTVRKELSEAIAAQATPKEKLNAILDYRMSRQLKNNFNGCPFVRIVNEISTEEEAPVLEIVKNNKQFIRDALFEVISSIDTPKPLSDELMTDNIFLLIEGAVQQGYIVKSEEPTQQAKKILNNLL